MKVCSECKQNKPLECFSKNANKKDLLSSHCKECHKILRRNHYLKNKDKILSQVKKNKKNFFEWYKSLKNSPCKDCGVSYPHYVMEFDHLYNKKFQLSYASKENYSKKKVLSEIEKCELVCANCHRARTFKRFNKASLT